MSPKRKHKNKDRKDSRPSSGSFGRRVGRREYGICLVLLAMTFVVYGQIRHHDFFEYDDGAYVSGNPQIQNGVTAAGLRWALTTGHASNWHPLTWISHMIDCDLYGITPGKHHLTSLWIHMANVLFLFFLLRRLTSSPWPSAFVAAVFAVHPLGAESVAWLSERKNVLSTFFWFLTMWVYISYTERPSTGRYLLVAGSLALGLMSKPMLVTAPLVLLLIDYWPLRRFEARPAVELAREKIPLLGLSAVSSVITILVQRGTAAADIESLPFAVRLVNAFVSYIKYIGLMVWPSGLAFFYPHPGHVLPFWQIAGSIAALLAGTWLALAAARKFPYVAVGWFWYVLTLIPVIGLVQVGRQAMADRYTYVPLIGLYILVAWGISDLTRKWEARKFGLGILGAAAILALMKCASAQAGHWRNSVAMYEHTVHVTNNNYLAHYNLGGAVFNQGNLDRAIHHFSEAVRIKPSYVRARLNLGRSLALQGKPDEAIAQYNEALRIEPDYADAHNNLGSVLARQGKLDEAIGHFSHVLKLAPNHLNALNNMGAAMLQKGNYAEAVAHYSRALAVDPNSAVVHYNLGLGLGRLGRYDEAVDQYTETLRLQPNYADAHYQLGLIHFNRGNLSRAEAHLTETLRLSPTHPSARAALEMIRSNPSLKNQPASPATPSAAP